MRHKDDQGRDRVVYKLGQKRQFSTHRTEEVGNVLSTSEFCVGQFAAQASIPNI